MSKGNIVREYAKEHGLKVVEMECPDWNREDLFGLPVLEEQQSKKPIGE